MQLTIVALREHGVEVVVLCPAKSPLIAWCRKHGVPVIGCSMMDCKVHSRRLMKLIGWLISRAISRHQIEIIHSNQVWTNPLASSIGSWLRIPVICHMRDYITPQGLHWFLNPSPQGVVCVSHHLEAYLRANGLPQHIPTITLTGPVTCAFQDSLESRNTMRSYLCKALRIPKDVRLVLFVGQFTQAKGLVLLLEAVEKWEGSGIHIILIGAKGLL
ncbi:MAG: glycosyltransferase, partial [Candidatus Kapabacteria bacterium]|nr:glycosyltransferase [Candidatus Kapabacteria bacterium]